MLFCKSINISSLCFLSAKKMLSFLFLFACMRFVLFVCLKSSCKKKIKRFKIALITSFILLLMTGLDIFYALFCIILFCFVHYKNDEALLHSIIKETRHIPTFMQLTSFLFHYLSVTFSGQSACLTLFFNFLEVVCLFIFLVQGFLFIYVYPS